MVPIVPFGIESIHVQIDLGGCATNRQRPITYTKTSMKKEIILLEMVLVSPPIQKILNLFFDKDMMRPYRIHVRLKEYFDKGKISMFPTLKQVQNYLAYEKKKTGIYIKYNLKFEIKN